MRYNPEIDAVEVYYNGQWYNIMTTNIQTMIPKMTSNVCNVGEASAAVNESGSEAYRAFDRSESTYACAGSIGNHTLTREAWVAFTFTYPRCATRVSLRNYAPNGLYRCSRFKIQASSDGITFVDLTDTLALPENTLVHYYNLNNTEEYIVYRINIIDVSWAHGGAVGIGDMQLHGN